MVAEFVVTFDADAEAGAVHTFGGGAVSLGTPTQVAPPNEFAPYLIHM